MYINYQHRATQSVLPVEELLRTSSASDRANYRWYEERRLFTPFRRRAKTMGYQKKIPMRLAKAYARGKKVRKFFDYELDWKNVDRFRENTKEKKLKKHRKQITRPLYQFDFKESTKNFEPVIQRNVRSRSVKRRKDLKMMRTRNRLRHDLSRLEKLRKVKSHFKQRKKVNRRNNRPSTTIPTRSRITSVNTPATPFTPMTPSSIPPSINFSPSSPNSLPNIGSPGTRPSTEHRSVRRKKEKPRLRRKVFTSEGDRRESKRLHHRLEKYKFGTHDDSYQYYSRKDQNNDMILYHNYVQSTLDTKRRLSLIKKVMKSMPYERNCEHHDIYAESRLMGNTRKMMLSHFNKRTPGVSRMPTSEMFMKELME